MCKYNSGIYGKKYNNNNNNNKTGAVLHILFIIYLRVVLTWKRNDGVQVVCIASTGTPKNRSNGKALSNKDGNYSNCRAYSRQPVSCCLAMYNNNNNKHRIETALDFATHSLAYIFIQANFFFFFMMEMERVYKLFVTENVVRLLFIMVLCVCACVGLVMGIPHKLV